MSQSDSDITVSVVIEEDGYAPISVDGAVLSLFTDRLEVCVPQTKFTVTIYLRDVYHLAPLAVVQASHMAPPELIFHTGLFAPRRYIMRASGAGSTTSLTMLYDILKDRIRPRAPPTFTAAASTAASEVHQQASRRVFGQSMGYSSAATTPNHNAVCGAGGGRRSMSESGGVSWVGESRSPSTYHYHAPDQNGGGATDLNQVSGVGGRRRPPTIMKSVTHDGEGAAHLMSAPYSQPSGGTNSRYATFRSGEAPQQTPSINAANYHPPQYPQHMFMTPSLSATLATTTETNLPVATLVAPAPGFRTTGTNTDASKDNELVLSNGEWVAASGIVHERTIQTQPAEGPVAAPAPPMWLLQRNLARMQSTDEALHNTAHQTRKVQHDALIAVAEMLYSPQWRQRSDALGWGGGGPGDVGTEYVLPQGAGGEDFRFDSNTFPQPPARVRSFSFNPPPSDAMLATSNKGSSSPTRAAAAETRKGSKNTSPLRASADVHTSHDRNVQVAEQRLQSKASLSALQRKLSARSRDEVLDALGSSGVVYDGEAGRSSAAVMSNMKATWASAPEDDNNSGARSPPRVRPPPIHIAQAAPTLPPPSDAAGTNAAIDAVKQPSVSATSPPSSTRTPYAVVQPTAASTTSPTFVAAPPPPDRTPSQPAVAAPPLPADRAASLLMRNSNESQSPSRKRLAPTSRPPSKLAPTKSVVATPTVHDSQRIPRPSSAYDGIPMTESIVIVEDAPLPIFSSAASRASPTPSSSTNDTLLSRIKAVGGVPMPHLVSTPAAVRRPTLDGDMGLMRRVGTTATSGAVR